MCDTKCVGHWNLVSEVGLPEPNRDVIFTYTDGINDYRMVDTGAYFTENLIDESSEQFERGEDGFYVGQLDLDYGALSCSMWYKHICSPKNVIAWYYLEPYEGEK